MSDPSDFQKDPRPCPVSQLSTSLPGVNTYIISHDESGKSIVHSKREGNWGHRNDNQLGINPVYTAPYNCDLNGEKDLQESDESIATDQTLVRKGGSVIRYYDHAPGFVTPMHRTVSWDLGVVLEGTVELILDDGSTTLLRRGDTVVQRATMHAWRNPSRDRWSRMLFVLNSIQPLKLGDKELGEEFHKFEEPSRI